MNILMIVNGAACGQDATYNAVRLSASMAKRDEVTRDYFSSELPAQSIRSAAECPCRVRTPAPILIRS